jgi:ABC-type multidrug transport system ATPase subunit
MSQVTVDRLQKTFGETRALDDVSLAVNPGEFLCVVGRTNAGKSTLLKTIAGIH